MIAEEARKWAGAEPTSLLCGRLDEAAANSVVGQNALDLTIQFVELAQHVIMASIELAQDYGRVDGGRFSHWL